MNRHRKTIRKMKPPIVEAPVEQLPEEEDDAISHDEYFEEEVSYNEQIFYGDCYRDWWDDLNDLNDRSEPDWYDWEYDWDDDYAEQPYYYSAEAYMQDDVRYVCTCDICMPVENDLEAYEDWLYPSSWPGLNMGIGEEDYDIPQPRKACGKYIHSFRAEALSRKLCSAKRDKARHDRSWKRHRQTKWRAA